MRDVPIHSGGVALEGALDLHRTKHGVMPRRLPAWTRSQLPSMAMDFNVACTAGVRASVRTNTRSLELDVHLNILESIVESGRQARFDLLVDGAVRDSVGTAVGSVVQRNPRQIGAVVVRSGPATTIRFRDLDGSLEDVEVWFPPCASVELRAVRVDDSACVERSARRQQLRWIHHGSSISQCPDAVSPTGSWPAKCARWSNLDLVNLGFAGNCLLDPYVARSIRDERAQLITAEIGLNIVHRDAFKDRTFTPALHGFLDTIRDGHPTTPIVIVSPLCSPTSEDRPGLPVVGAAPISPAAPALGSLTLRRIRQLIEDVVRSRVEGGDRSLRYVDGLRLLGSDEAQLLQDGVHLSNAGNALIGRRFHEQVVLTECRPELAWCSRGRQ
jgi:hypothetical protein